MTAIPKQSLDFLHTAAPFDVIENDDLLALSRDITVAYLTQENADQIIREQGECLFLISSGQFSVKDSNGPLRHLSEGDYFGFSNLLDNLKHQIEVDVDSPGLVYCLKREAFEKCLSHYPTFARFFETSKTQSLQNEAVNDSKSIWLYRQIRDVIEREAISADETLPAVDAVKIMSREQVSSLLITHEEKLVGIITDRDIRNRVVAAQADVSLPVSTIMTPEPAKIAQHRTMFDALCLMTEHNIHHLPVVEPHTQKPVGMLTASDMIRHQRGNVLFMIDELARAKNLYELTRLSWQMPHYFAKHAKRLGDFDIAGKVLSQATDIMTRKLLTFFQQKHGNPPFDYCWLVYGSQAREDQTMGSDQDNALLLAEKPDEQAAQYFADMAEYVCQGLGKCGIKLCDGNIMASNPELRLSIDDAVKEAQQWVNQPTNKAIMHFNIFLDVRPVAGNTDLFRELKKARAPLLKQSMFLAALARHTNDINVPLSMFQKFVYEKNHSKDDCINIKVNAVAIINNLVRIYALANEVSAPSTLARLANMPEDSGLSQKDADNLRDIWLFLNRLRWRHQLHNKVTDNLVSIDDLSSIEKHQLKAAFQAIKRAQQGVVMKFAGGMG